MVLTTQDEFRSVPSSTVQESSEGTSSSSWMPSGSGSKASDQNPRCLRDMPPHPPRGALPPLGFLQAEPCIPSKACPLALLMWRTGAEGTSQHPEGSRCPLSPSFLSPGESWALHFLRHQAAASAGALDVGPNVHSEIPLHFCAEYSPASHGVHSPMDVASLGEH